MKKIFQLLIISTFFLSSSAFAIIVETVHIDFQSGAEFDGTITFSDDYSSMLDTDGYLNGGSNGFSNEHFNWTWWAGTGSSSYDSNSDGLLNDWLMNGTASNNYSMYIGLSWDASVSSLAGGISFDTDVSSSYFNGNSVYDDLIVGFSTNAIPEPSVIALFGLGLVGIGFARRRRNS